jgi:energy-coupling factor transport system permease protein
MIEYLYKESFIHRLHPLTKLAFSACIMIMAMIFTEPVYLLGVIALVMTLSIAGRILKESMGYLLTMAFFAIIVLILQCLFLNKGHVYFTVFPASWPIVGGWLPISKGGLIFGTAMALRVMAIISVFPMLITTTQPRDIVMSLVETLKVPYDYAFMFTTALRFIPVIIGEVTIIYQAQLSRAHAVEGFNPIKKIKAFAPIAFPILFIAIEKAERLGLCMELRGYKSGTRTYFKKLKFSFLDTVAFFSMFLLMVMTFWLRFHGLGRSII